MLFSALLLCACNVSEMSSLTAFAKPYTGVYECETLTLGGDDVLDKFQYIELELKSGGQFTLSYRTAEGNEGETEGEYTMDEANGWLVMSKKLPLRTVERRFAYREGAIYIDVNYAGSLLHAKFAMP